MPKVKIHSQSFFHQNNKVVNPVIKAEHRMMDIIELLILNFSIQKFAKFSYLDNLMSCIWEYNIRDIFWNLDKSKMLVWEFIYVCNLPMKLHLEFGEDYSLS